MYLGLRGIPEECRSHSFHGLASISHKNERDDGSNKKVIGMLTSVQIGGLLTKRKTRLKSLGQSLLIYVKT
jgi:hypothetical protein